MADKYTLSHLFKVLFYAWPGVEVSANFGYKTNKKTPFAVPSLKVLSLLVSEERPSLLVGKCDPKEGYKRRLCLYLAIRIFIMETLNGLGKNQNNLKKVSGLNHLSK